LVDVIMQQLLSKDVLYQPMKDIGARYPEWLQENREKLEAEDVTRYEQQQEYIQQICELYETEPENFSKLMELIQEVRYTEINNKICCFLLSSFLSSQQIKQRIMSEHNLCRCNKEVNPHRKLSMNWPQGGLLVQMGCRLRVIVECNNKI